MARWTRTDPALGVREALIAKLASHVRQTYDPRLALGLQAGETPEPDPDYVDRIADLYDDLVAGKAVNVARWMLSRIAEVPPGCWSVHIDVDGTISPSPYERAGTEPAP